MNAPGISVFYGATDMDTCVHEVRPPVGSHVVAASFEVLRTLRLLDLDALERIYVKTSYFDPEYAFRRGQALFLQGLGSEISRPVMPQDETTEYLATQAMAEYLASRLAQPLDGIIYRSLQITDDMYNIVLLNHARRVEPRILPQGTKVEIPALSTSYRGVLYEHRDIAVNELVPPDPPPAEAQPAAEVGRHPVYLNLTNDQSPDAEDQENYDQSPYYEPTLRLDLESVVVLKITGARYESTSRAVHWRRRQQS